MSRDKGRRYENELVELLKQRGFTAWRVPLSGAMGGMFSSDVRVMLAGQEYRVEVKMRSTPQAASATRILPKLPFRCQGYRVFFLETLDDQFIMRGEACKKLPKSWVRWLNGAHILAVRLPKRFTSPYGGLTGWIIVLPDTLWDAWRSETSSDFTS